MKINWRSGVGYAFIIIAIALVSIASSLVYHPERIVTFEFWVIVALKTLVSVLTFNIIYFNNMLTRRADAKSSLYATFSDYARYVTSVYKDGKQADVRKRIADGNAARYAQAANVAIQKITSALRYEDVKSVTDKTADIDALCVEYMLTRRESKRLRIVVKNAINGRIKYEHLDYNHIMLNNDVTKHAHPSMVVNEKTDLAIKNINIAINGAIFSALFTIFAMGEMNNLFYEIVSNGTTISFAIFNAYRFTHMQSNKLKNAYQARQDFLCEFIKPSEPVRINAVTQTVETEARA